MPDIQKPVRPDTSLLDAAREQADALAQYQRDVENFERAQKGAAEAKVRAERIARQKQCLARCQEYAVEAEQAARQLASALDRFVAASERRPDDVYGHVKEFLAPYVRKYGDLMGRNSDGSADVLTHELFPEVDRAL